MNKPESFGGWVKRRRGRLDLTQRALAELVGCAAITIRKIEADQLRPSRQIAGRLFAALELEASERAAFAAAARGEQLGRAPFPVLLTPLIGREDAVSAACALLSREDVRLVTLYGPPGIGKTSLALHVAGRLQPGFADGAICVALAEVDDPGRVVEAIAAGVGIHEAGDRPLRAQLHATLRDRHLLLLLDNFEQLLDAAPELAALLAVAGGVKLLVTSRAVLRITGEHPLLLAPLELPAASLRLAEVAGSAAVRLFVQRAQAAAPGFRLSAANAPAVAAICARMDGLPLALELAAARTRLWTADELLARLDAPPAGALQLLTGGRRDQPLRQQTLSDAIAWSYRLLNLEQQRVFRQLGVFVGGFTLAAAEQLLAGTRSATADALQSLLDSSLLQRQTSSSAAGAQRFGMLETLREYAIEQLEASAEAVDVRERHAGLMLGLARAAERACHYGDWLERLETEHANMRAALAWFSCSSAENGLRLACALDHYWFARGHVSEGRQWFTTLLAAVGAATGGPLRAQALCNAGYLAWFQSDRAAAAGYFAAAQGLFQALGNRRGQAWTLLGLARVARFQGDYSAAEAYCRSAVALFSAIEDRAGCGWVANELGQVALMQAENERAAEQFRRSRALFDGTQQLDGTADALWGLGTAELARERYAEADAAYVQSLVLWRSIGEKLGSAGALAGLGSVALAKQQYRQAASQLNESLALHWELGNTWGLLGDLVALAAVETRNRLRGEHPDLSYERALRMLGAAGALQRSTGVPLWPVYEIVFRRTEAEARARLSTVKAAAALAEGASMPLDELIGTLLPTNQWQLIDSQDAEAP